MQGQQQHGKTALPAAQQAKLDQIKKQRDTKPSSPDHAIWWHNY